MRDPNYCFRSVSAACLCLAILLPSPAVAVDNPAAKRTEPPAPYVGVGEGKEFNIDLEKGTISPNLPFDVSFKIKGNVPPGFGFGSRIDARFVEFNGPPDCATFFSQYALAKRGLPDLNATDAIPVRRRRRSRALSTSGFRQAAVFDSGGVTLQARRVASAAAFGENLGPLDGGGSDVPTAGGIPPSASFLADFPPLRPNHYYCFQFISRRSLSKEDLDDIRKEFRKVVDTELRDEKYQEDRGAGDKKATALKAVKEKDYEKLRKTLSALLESTLAEKRSANHVVLAPPNSFFNVGAVREIREKYRTEFSSIAALTVLERLPAIKEFSDDTGDAVDAFRKLAGLQVTGGETESSLASLLREPALSEKRQQIETETGIDPVDLLELSEERLEKRFMGVPEERAEAPELKDVWPEETAEGGPASEIQEIKDRLDDLKALSDAISSLTELAEAAGVDASQLVGELEGVSKASAADQLKSDAGDEAEAADEAIADAQEARKAAIAAATEAADAAAGADGPPAKPGATAARTAAEQAKVAEAGAVIAAANAQKALTTLNAAYNEEKWQEVKDAAARVKEAAKAAARAAAEAQASKAAAVAAAGAETAEAVAGAAQTAFAQAKKALQTAAQEETPAADSSADSSADESKESFVTQTVDFLYGARQRLLKLQRILQKRSKEIEVWIDQILVEEQASLVVGATTVADYDTRASWYMSADVGSGISELEEFFTYVGWNVYLRPVNKKAHLSWTNRPFGLGEELMRRLSFTLGVVQSGFTPVSGQTEGVIGTNAAVLGAGFRINDSLRLSGGGVIFEEFDPDPLVNSKRLAWSPYLAISLEWNILGAVSGLGGN